MKKLFHLNFTIKFPRGFNQFSQLYEFKLRI